MTSSDIVQKLWNYCNVLRDDGTSYGDCVEQLTQGQEIVDDLEVALEQVWALVPDLGGAGGTAGSASDRR